MESWHYRDRNWILAENCPVVNAYRRSLAHARPDLLKPCKPHWIFPSIRRPNRIRYCWWRSSDIVRGYAPVHLSSTDENSRSMEECMASYVPQVDVFRHRRWFRESKLGIYWRYWTERHRRVCSSPDTLPRCPWRFPWTEEWPFHWHLLVLVVAGVFYSYSLHRARKKDRHAHFQIFAIESVFNRLWRRLWRTTLRIASELDNRVDLVWLFWFLLQSSDRREDFRRLILRRVYEIDSRSPRHHPAIDEQRSSDSVSMYRSYLSRWSRHYRVLRRQWDSSLGIAFWPCALLSTLTWP